MGVPYHSSDCYCEQCKWPSEEVLEKRREDQRFKNNSFSLLQNILSNIDISSLSLTVNQSAVVNHYAIITEEKLNYIFLEKIKNAITLTAKLEIYPLLTPKEKELFKKKYKKSLINCDINIEDYN